jgi:hypothetical protein
MERLEQPKFIADTVCDVGENPFWHPDAESLFFLQAISKPSVGRS